MRHNLNIKLVLWRRRDAGATKIAGALDKRLQSKESGRSGNNRCFRFPIEDK